MLISCRVPRIATVLAAVACALGISARAQSCPPNQQPNQICVSSPSNWTSMPVWLRADAPTSCQGNSNITAFGYSIDSSPFFTPGKTNTAIDTIDFRLASRQSPYTVHYKAWSDLGECDYDVSVNVNVSGVTTHPVTNVNQAANDPGWSQLVQSNCATANSGGVPLLNWYWEWDDGTGRCTLSDTTTYDGISTPSMDGNSRVFYTDWLWNQQNPQNPGERYSIIYANGATGATNFVYDTYIYLEWPVQGNPNTNIQDIEMDTNQVWDSNGDVLILGLECDHSANSWKFTTNVGGVDTWNKPSGGQTPLACDPQKWATNGWHHVQLAGHRFQCTDGTWGCASYDYIVFDGTYTQLTSWNGNSSFSKAWVPGDLLINLQVDGVDSSSEVTATVYTDGMEMIWW